MLTASRGSRWQRSPDFFLHSLGGAPDGSGALPVPRRSSPLTQSLRSRGRRTGQSQHATGAWPKTQPALPLPGQREGASRPNEACNDDAGDCGGNLELAVDFPRSKDTHFGAGGATMMQGAALVTFTALGPQQGPRAKRLFPSAAGGQETAAQPHQAAGATVYEARGLSQ